MNRGTYLRLAGMNLKKNYKNLLPYVLSCIGTVMMYFIMETLAENPGIYEMNGAEYLSLVMSLGTNVIALFAVIFLFYSHSFLIKRRKKEFGLYYMLGMEKKHLARVLAYETICMGAGSLTVGISFGILLYRLMYMILMKLSGLKGTVDFFFSAEAFRDTLLLFGIIFLMNYLNSLRQIGTVSPIELLRGSEAGEKEPKAKAAVVVIGLLATGIGYYMALTCDNSLEAIEMFFVAIVFVIIGTYCLFSSGSIALLKLLKKNKSYYYRARHFTGISGMLYRMKQNAAGLSNICILSTGVLLVISITACLWNGADQAVTVRYPHEVNIHGTGLTEEETAALRNAVSAVMEKEEVSPVYQKEISYLTFYAIADGNQLRGGMSGGRGGVINVTDLSKMTAVSCVEQSWYEQYTGIKEPVKKGTVRVLCADGEDFGYDSVAIGDAVFEAEECGSERVQPEGNVQSLMSSLTLIFADKEDLYAAYAAAGGEEVQVMETPGMDWSYDLDFDLSKDRQIALGDVIGEQLRFSDKVWVEVREQQRGFVRTLYGGILFFGIFVGTLFLMATVMIIYYKQISEGYDDRHRFAIMQKVGMSRKEIRRSIRSQVLTVFFMPLLTAVIHTLVAFPFTKKIMALMNFTDTAAFRAATGVTIAVFAVVYIIVYALTARSYERIVQED